VGNASEVKRKDSRREVQERGFKNSLEKILKGSVDVRAGETDLKVSVNLYAGRRTSSHLNQKKGKKKKPD